MRVRQNLWRNTASHTLTPHSVCLLAKWNPVGERETSADKRYRHSVMRRRVDKPECRVQFASSSSGAHRNVRFAELSMYSITRTPSMSSMGHGSGAKREQRSPGHTTGTSGLLVVG